MELGQRMYFTAARCRAAIAEARAVARWLPPPPADQVASEAGSPSLGGC